MALAVSIRFDFVDDKGKTSFTKVYVPNGFTIAQYVEFAQGFAQLLANASQAVVTRASVVFSMSLAGATIKATANFVSDIAQKAFFQFRTAVGGFFARMKIPAVKETLVNVGSDSIDVDDLNVAAFITAMENGIVSSGVTIQPVDDRGNDIVDTTIAREVFRKK
jgi:hypothetical protein